jgi:predicted small metal-binding protein
MKTLRCKDVGFDCAGVIEGETEEEVLEQAAEHARTTHQIEVTPELVAQIRLHILEEALPG